MIIINLKKIFLTIIFFSILFSVKANAIINIVAAENTYGEIAKELGGPYVNVVNILNNPSQDPHLFTTTPSTAKAVNLADIVIYNGGDYDPWMKSVLTIKGSKMRAVIDVAALNNIKSGENPHVWYAPTTIPIFVAKLAKLFIQLDHEHQSYYENQLNQFMHSYQIIFEIINRIKQRFQGTPVIATEPVFNYMTNALGLIMHGEDFQINMMNDIPPTVSQIKSFEDDLRHHAVRVLIYNKQVVNPLTERMLKIANEEKIQVLGVSETIPPGLTFIQWIVSELTQLETKLENSEKTT